MLACCPTVDTQHCRLLQSMTMLFVRLISKCRQLFCSNSFSLADHVSTHELCHPLHPFAAHPPTPTDSQPSDAIFPS